MTIITTAAESSAPSSDWSGSWQVPPWVRSPRIGGSSQRWSPSITFPGDSSEGPTVSTDELSPWGTGISGATQRADLRSPPVTVTDRWEGVITEVVDDYFAAEIKRTYGTGTDLLGEFNLEAVDEDDRSLVRPGAWFYVIVGRTRALGRRSSTVSSLRFRRLPPWQEEDLSLVKQRAAKRRLQLGVDDHA